MPASSAAKRSSTIKLVPRSLAKMAASSKPSLLSSSSSTTTSSSSSTPAEFSSVTLTPAEKLSYSSSSSPSHRRRAAFVTAPESSENSDEYVLVTRQDHSVEAESRVPGPYAGPTTGNAANLSNPSNQSNRSSLPEYGNVILREGVGNSGSSGLTGNANPSNQFSSLPEYGNVVIREDVSDGRGKSQYSFVDLDRRLVHLSSSGSGSSSGYSSGSGTTIISKGGTECDDEYMVMASVQPTLEKDVESDSRPSAPVSIPSQGQSGTGTSTEEHQLVGVSAGSPLNSSYSSELRMRTRSIDYHLDTHKHTYVNVNEGDLKESPSVEKRDVVLPNKKPFPLPRNASQTSLGGSPTHPRSNSGSSKSVTKTEEQQPLPTTPQSS